MSARKRGCPCHPHMRRHTRGQAHEEPGTAGVRASSLLRIGQSTHSTERASSIPRRAIHPEQAAIRRRGTRTPNVHGGIMPGQQRRSDKSGACTYPRADVGGVRRGLGPATRR